MHCFIDSDSVYWIQGCTTDFLLCFLRQALLFSLCMLFSCYVFVNSDVLDVQVLMRRSTKRAESCHGVSPMRSGLKMQSDDKHAGLHSSQSTNLLQIE